MNNTSAAPLCFCVCNPWGGPEPSIKNHQHLLSRYRNPLRLCPSALLVADSLNWYTGYVQKKRTLQLQLKRCWYSFYVSFWQEAGGFHAHQACAFVLEAERSMCLSKAEEDLQYKSAYIHWDVGCVWLSHWMGGWMLNLLHLFYVRLQALVQIEYLSCTSHLPDQIKPWLRLWILSLFTTVNVLRGAPFLKVSFIKCAYI